MGDRRERQRKRERQPLKRRGRETRKENTDKEIGVETDRSGRSEIEKNNSMIVFRGGAGSVRVH